MNITQLAFKDTSEFGRASTSMGGQRGCGYSAQWPRQRVHVLAYAIVTIKTWQIPSQEKQRWGWSTNVCASKMDVLRYCSRGFNYEHFWSAGHLPQCWLLSLWVISTPFLKGQASEASLGYTSSKEDSKERKHCRTAPPKINGAACFHPPVSSASIVQGSHNTFVTENLPWQLADIINSRLRLGCKVRGEDGQERGGYNSNRSLP